MVRIIALPSKPPRKLVEPSNGQGQPLPSAEADQDAVPPLLLAPDLMEQIGEAMRRGGYAGDLLAPLLAYVAFTSRWLDRPMNLAFVAPSAAGKNRAIDSAMRLQPPDASHFIRAGSPRCLIYSDQEYAHRVVIFGEADSIPKEGSAASAIRSLAEDNVMIYEVVERVPKTNQFKTRRIEKPGPTGLITTSTRSLGFEMGTRVLEVSLPDDPRQTRAIMRAQALAAQGVGVNVPDLTAFLDAQAWLGTCGVHAVVVPFADCLAELIPSDAVRMRRDFRQLITCIQAVALLHQCQRTLTANGVVEATLEDYEIVRGLLAPVFDSTNADGLTDAIRETVDAVAPGERVTESALAMRLRVSKSTVSYRVARAINRGWLENHETRKGCAAKIARGAPLPATGTCLPTPDAVKGLFECSSGSGGGRPDNSRRRIIIRKK